MSTKEFRVVIFDSTTLEGLFRCRRAEVYEEETLLAYGVGETDVDAVFSAFNNLFRAEVGR